MKVSDFLQYLNKPAFYRLQSGIVFDVIVIDVKPGEYGNIRFMIKPASGSGSCTVNKESIKFVNS